MLPETLRELVRVIGVAATLRLVETHGGVVLNVPSRLGATHELVRVLGMAAAESLVAWGAGDRIYIPRAERAIRCLRDQEIRRRYDAGEGVRTLARTYRLSERRIWAILSLPDPETIGPGHVFSKALAARQLSFCFEDLQSDL